MAIRRHLVLLVLAAAALSAPALGPAAAAAESGPPVEKARKGERAEGVRSRGAAERALERAKALRKGRGVRTGRELSPALKELAIGLPGLDEPRRREAEALLSRPTDGPSADPPFGGYSVPEAAPHCTASFCVHYVTSTADAPSLTDGDSDAVPDYVERVAAELETSRAVENGSLGWIAPVGDGSRGEPLVGGTPNRTDAYLKELGTHGIFGYASVDPGQTGPARSAYLVLDDDYADFGGSPTPLLQVTVAHEYNHVLQYAYDVFQDVWHAESTATWMEDQVYDSVDDYLSYVTAWATLSETPLTQPSSDTNLKAYGDAVWNHWLAERYGHAAVRRAQEVSFPAGSFAPASYDAAIRDFAGQGFYDEFNRFSAATAEWRTPGSGFSEGPSYPEVERLGALSADGAQVTGQLHHTTFALHSVATTTASQVTLTGSLPSGTAGALALVGRTAAGTLTTRLTPLPAGGSGSATLENPGTYARITAVVMNADTSRSGFSSATDDWTWTKDSQPYSARLTTGAAPPPVPPPSDGTVVPDSSGGAPPAGSGAAAAPAADTSKPRLTLSASRRQRAADVARKGLAVTLRSSDPDALRYALEASVTSRALRARPAAVVGRRSGTLARGATARVRIKLSRAALRALRARRSLRVTVSVALRDPQGNGARIARTVVVSR